MSVNARNNIFKRLRAVSLNQQLTIATDKLATSAAGAASVALRVQQFIKKMQASHAEVVECDGDDLERTVAKLIKQKAIARCLISERSAWLQKHNIGETQCIYFPAQIENFKSELFNDIGAAITTSHAAIAETGTVVLWPDTIEPRSMSLVPPLHIVIVERECLYANFAQLIERQNWQAGMPTNVVLVSGPSKTADIQQTLAYGAHGPCELIVVLVTEI